MVALALSNGKSEDYMLEFYDVFRAVHVISIIAWMATLLYLPRLFVYHAEQRDNSAFKEVVEVQEKRLYYGIGHPAMLMAIVSGSLMIIATPELFKSGGWLHVKLSCVVLLIIFHFFCGFYRKSLSRGDYKSAGFFRIFNEIPTVLMIAIVIMAIVKPF